MRRPIAFLVLTLTLSLSVSLEAIASFEEMGEVTAEDLEDPKKTSGRVYSPYAGREYPDQVLWGDTHFHTKLSPDAGLLGNTIGAEEAYRMARGEPGVSNTGQPVQLIRPLDFLVITDHAEYIGLAPMVREGNPALLSDPWGKSIYDGFQAGGLEKMKAFQSIIASAMSDPPVNRLSNSEMVAEIWSEFLKVADQYDEPGRFSAMVGFEWTSTPSGNNLHRVLTFRDGADKAGQVLPYSVFDSQDPEDLWAWMAAYEKKTGGQILAVPHNANVSNGLMFSETTFSGKPITRAYAETRARWEPLHEMSQMKGDEETHPLLSPEDEFADFETWDVANLGGSVPKEEWMLKHEYARSALKLGLKIGQEVGANPFKYGFSAATDTHTGIATSREENYFGKMAKTEPSPTRHDGEVIPAEDKALRITTAQEGAQGLLAVWARENTRGQVFDAMKRKEAYATTGTRIVVRMFGGYDFSEEDLRAADFAAVGYGGGVPMGGDLRKAPPGKAPTLLIRALRDADGANLDRVQVIKGWVDSTGKTHERIYDVAVSDDREIGRDGRCKTAVGTTVDLEKATYSNTIGDPMLATRWMDPDFDAKQPAFYYVRVLEIPTPRWTTYDAAFYGIERPDVVPATVQDRAYTSAIWYTP